jgi:hypothetical protein
MLTDTLPGPLSAAEVLWQFPVAQVPSPGEPLEPALPAEYSALLEVMLVNPNENASAEKRMSSDFFIDVVFISNKKGVKQFTFKIRKYSIYTLPVD